ncbi:hypothetical protein Cni_G01759 [Canna indica]|uniref:C3H1-type domain-containing protein n=1 Tax=Canna indica TaxID=4628 RepID=A0AAQ3JNF9_9LILI|nr:hypothetical protein Cni_G01759 [Canna indica]
MCGGPEHVRASSRSLPSALQGEKSKKSNSGEVEGMSRLDEEFDDSSPSVLELAANNDVGGFRQLIDCDSSAAEKVGLWYSRAKGSNRMVLERRTPLMVAATYGSLDVLGLLLSLPSVEVNRASGRDKSTALHCAASGGSAYSADAVKLLLSAGADPNSVDANGHRPADVIVVPLKLPDAVIVLEELLGRSCNNGTTADRQNFLSMITRSSNSDSPPLSSSPDAADGSLSTDLTSPVITTEASFELQQYAAPEKKEYPVDPSFPDIKNSIYATDEFRMYSFKVRPCSRAYSHDWTECPFVHPGENARRRDPRKFHYSCVPCPDFRKGACRRGDLCEYAHGVFECWLHPAQYRTRLCKDGTTCSRRVCFFAHTNEELRPLHMSASSSVLSPLSSSAALEMVLAMGLVPVSPSAASAVMASFTPISPSGNGVGHSSLVWPQPNGPAPHGGNFQASRLRSSLSARGMPVDDSPVVHDCDTQQLLNDICYSRLSSSLSRTAQPKTLTPSNLDDLFAAEINSYPKFNVDQGSIFSPSHKTDILNQCQQHQHSRLPPINTVYSPKAMDCHQQSGHSALLQASLCISSQGRMSPRGMEPPSSMSSHLSLLAQKEKQPQTLQSMSSLEFGFGTSPVCSSANLSLPKWASPSGTLDRELNGEGLGFLRQSSSEFRANSDEPDVSWVHSLVRESPSEKVATALVASATHSGLQPANGAKASSSDHQSNDLDQAAIRALLEKMQLD